MWSMKMCSCLYVSKRQIWSSVSVLHLSTIWDWMPFSTWNVSPLIGSLVINNRTCDSVRFAQGSMAIETSLKCTQKCTSMILETFHCCHWGWTMHRVHTCSSNQSVLLPVLDVSEQRKQNYQCWMCQNKGDKTTSVGCVRTKETKLPVLDVSEQRRQNYQLHKRLLSTGWVVYERSIQDGLHKQVIIYRMGSVW